MTSETNERYIGGQVRSRANVILTRRDDLRVVETKDQTGLDMHVYVDREDKPMRLVFGVLLRGVPSPTTADQANKVLGPDDGVLSGAEEVHLPRLPVLLHGPGRTGVLHLARRAGRERGRPKARPPDAGELRRADGRLARRKWSIALSHGTTPWSRC